MNIKVPAFTVSEKSSNTAMTELRLKTGRALLVIMVINCSCDYTRQLISDHGHNFQKLKNISLKAVNFFSNKNISNLFE